jgi:hypothetical protein
MNRKRIIAILPVLLLLTGASAQSLQGLTSNPVIRKALKERPVQLKSATANPLTLPFFEDFSTSSIFPDPAKWSDENAFVNNSFGLEPISMGVATLDAIDASGEVYGLSALATSSDELTTQPFDLSPYAGGPQVRLSFFFQAGGRGEAPEKQDSRPPLSSRRLSLCPKVIVSMVSGSGSETTPAFRPPMQQEEREH